MADGYLESHYAEYEKRKAAWLKKKKKFSYNGATKTRPITALDNGKNPTNPS